MFVLQEGVVEEVMVKLKQLVQDLQHHLADSRRGERLRSGLQLAILGQPNVGKSSLLNALTQRPTAIVSPIPGKCIGCFYKAIHIIFAALTLFHMKHQQYSKCVNSSLTSWLLHILPEVL